MDERFYLEVLKVMKRGSDSVNEILKITQELGEVISRDDRVSTQMLIGMRQEEMDKIDACNKDMDCLVNSLPSDEGGLLRALLKGEEIEDKGPAAMKVMELAKQKKRLFERILAVDERISKRLAGNNSFYTG